VGKDLRGSGDLGSRGLFKSCCDIFGSVKQQRERFLRISKSRNLSEIFWASSESFRKMMMVHDAHKTHGRITVYNPYPSFFPF